MQNDEVIPDSVSDASASEANEPSVPAVQIETDAVTDYDCSHCGCKIDVSGLPAFTQVECPDCGAIETVPARLGNFLLLRLLGMGGMGGVYYARDTALGRDVAIKVMLQSLGDDAKFIETFRKEAQAVAKLNHPNIAQIYSFGQEKGQPYIVMELVSGERVDDMLESEGGIPVPLAMKIGLEVAEGLSAADEAGLVHGDIKPENILLDTKGHAKLVDFGLATVAHAAASDGIWGTPYYIAPEKIRRQKVDARADIYSLGATLFHMITGNPPFEGETPVEVVKARLEQPPPDIKELYPDIPDKAADVIMRMLAVDRTERHPNYKSLIGDFNKALSELDAAKPKAGKHIRIRKKGAKFSAPIDDNAAADSGGGKRKIVIRKDKGSPALTLKQSTSLSGKVEHEETAEKPAKPEPTPEELERKRKKRRRAAKRALITFCVILIIAAISGIVGYVIYRKDQKLKQRAEWFALKEAQEQADVICKQITGIASNSVKLVAKTENYEETLKDAILTITGQELVVPPLEPDPVPEEEETVSDTNTTGVAESDTNATEVVASNTNTAIEGTEPDVAEAEPEGDPEAEPEAEPEVESSEEPIEEDQAPAEEQPEEIVVDEPVAEIVPDEDLPEIAVTARNAIINLQKMHRMNDRIQNLIAPATNANITAQSALSSKLAKASVKELKSLANKATLYRDSVKALYDAVQDPHKEVVAAKVEFERKQEAIRQAEIEAKKRAEEEARKERERQEYEAKEQAEIEQAKLDKGEMKPMIMEHAFDQALETLKQKSDGYTTEGGIKAFATVVDSYTYVVDMHKEIIAAINAEPFHWGWGSGTATRDVLSADKKGVKVSGSSAVIPWNQVNVGQMLRFVDHYLASRSVRATGKIKLAMGAAIYCSEFGEKAKVRAKGYLSRALDMGLPQTEADRLIELGW